MEIPDLWGQMIHYQRNINFINKLIKETKQNQLSWSETKFKSTKYLSNDGEIIGKIYEAILNNKVILIYRFKYKQYNDEFDYYWCENIILEITDDEHKTEYKIDSDKNLINNLYESIRFKEAKIDDYFKSIGI